MTPARPSPPAAPRREARDTLSPEGSLPPSLGDAEVVGMGDLGALEAPGMLVTHALGSCVGVALHDPGVGVAALLHAMLPDSAIDLRRAHGQPMAFVDLGVPAALGAVEALGADRRRVVAHLFGGAAIPGAPALYRIGDRNLAAARQLLLELRIPIVAEDVGGDISRTVRIDAATGAITLSTPGRPARHL